MMGQAIEHGGGHPGIAEYLRPVGEGQIGRDQQRGVFVQFADQVEQQLAARLAEWQVAQFVDLCCARHKSNSCGVGSYVELPHEVGL